MFHQIFVTFLSHRLYQNETARKTTKERMSNEEVHVQPECASTTNVPSSWEQSSMAASFTGFGLGRDL
jgi:hypothetical protein